MQDLQMLCKTVFVFYVVRLFVKHDQNYISGFGVLHTKMGSASCWKAGQQKCKHC